MQKLLVKTFIKDHENVKDPQVREKYGSLTGIVGICSNAVLCVMKILIGIITGSMSILADGLNNLADGASSIITLVGFKLAARPADEDHPYGHARIEYITGLIISFLMFAGRVGGLSLALVITEKRDSGAVEKPEENVLIG